MSSEKCKWRTRLGSSVKKDCGFVFDVIEEKDNYKIVVLPKNTKLYHITVGNLRYNNQNWWENSWPFNTVRGGIFFTPSEEHLPVNGNFKLVYETKKQIPLIYIDNLKKHNSRNGNEFICGNFSSLLRENEKYDILGYISCNECELFLLNNYIKDCIYKKPKEIKDISKFID